MHSPDVITVTWQVQLLFPAHTGTVIWQVHVWNDTSQALSSVADLSAPNLSELRVPLSTGTDRSVRFAVAFTLRHGMCGGRQH